MKIKDLLISTIDNRGKTPPVANSGHCLLEINCIAGKQKYPDYTLIKKYVSEDTYKTWFRSGHPRTGDILIPTVGTLDAIGICDRDDCCIAQNLVALRVNPEICDREFLYYLFCNPIVRKRLLQLDIGAVQPSIKVPHLKNLDISIPNIKKQKKIAYVLRLFDDKIANNVKINKTLEAQAQTIFDSFYGQAEREVEFTSIIKIFGGGTPRTKEESYWNGGIPFFTPKDVEFPYVLSTEKNITSTGLDNCNSRLYPINTTFVTARGTVGKVSLAGVPMAMNQSCYALIGNSIHPILTYFYTLKTVQSLRHKASGAVFDAIVTSDFKTEIIKKLSEDDEEKVLSLINPMMESILQNSIENSRLVKLRDVLLPRLMSGKIDVLNVED